MSVNYNSKIVTEGLVLHLDASNPKSYPGIPSAEVLVVAGGGGGGMDMGGGGGGGGVIRNSSVPITLGVGMPVVVGAGGWGAPAASGGYRGDGAGPQPYAHAYTIPATDGENSSFAGLTAYGGGHGASSYFGYTPDQGSGGKIAGNGGSGGGMSGYSDGSYKSGGSSIFLISPLQGFAGGTGGPQYYSGGGGGAGGVGISGPSTPHGGIGVESSINGTSYYWGGGGGGGGYSIGGGNGGIGGGGGGAVGTTTGGDGLNAGAAGGGGVTFGNPCTPGGNGGANTGGGGGGGSHYNATNQGGNGGSGIVIIRYLGPQNATGGTITSANGYTIHTFTSSGTFTPADPWYVWQDLSPAGNQGVIYGATHNSAGYLTCDGVDDYIDTSVYVNKHMTINIWYRRKRVDHTTGIHPLIHAANLNYPASNTWWDLNVLDPYYGNGGTIEIWAYGYLNDVRDDFIISPYPASIYNQWRNLCIVFTNGTGVAYLDGISLGAGDAPNFIEWDTATTRVGLEFARDRRYEYSSGPYNYGNQDIANIQVYNRALSASEVLQNFNALRGRYQV